MRQQIRKSNIMLIGAGIFLMVMMLASIITARVVFDRTVSYRTVHTSAVYLDNRS